MSGNRRTKYEIHIGIFRRPIISSLTFRRISAFKYPYGRVAHARLVIWRWSRDVLRPSELCDGTRFVDKRCFPKNVLDPRPATRRPKSTFSRHALAHYHYNNCSYEKNVFLSLSRVRPHEIPTGKRPCTYTASADVTLLIISHHGRISILQQSKTISRELRSRRKTVQSTRPRSLRLPTVTQRLVTVRFVRRLLFVLNVRRVQIPNIPAYCVRSRACERTRHVANVDRCRVFTTDRRGCGGWRVEGDRQRAFRISLRRGEAGLDDENISRVVYIIDTRSFVSHCFWAWRATRSSQTGTSSDGHASCQRWTRTFGTDVFERTPPDAK